MARRRRFDHPNPTTCFAIAILGSLFIGAGGPALAARLMQREVPPIITTESGNIDIALIAPNVLAEASNAKWDARASVFAPGMAGLFFLVFAMKGVFACSERTRGA